MYRVAYKRPYTHVSSQPSSTTAELQKTARPFVPFANIITKENGWDIEISLPGYTKEEVNIALANNRLTISGKKEKSPEKFNRREWNNEWFERYFTLGDNADTEKISAEMNHGILTLRVAKKEKIVTKIDVQ